MYPSTEKDSIAIVNKKLTKAYTRFSEYLDRNLFIESNKFFALLPEEFKQTHSIESLSRLAFYFFWIRRNIKSLFGAYPQKLHLHLRVFPTQLNFIFEKKHVIGILISFSLRSPYEMIEENDIVFAIKKLISNIKIPKESYYLLQLPQDPVQTIYLEIEKINGSLFYLEEIALLKNKLPIELKTKFKNLVPSLFMVRNEEEIIKNIVTLSKQLDSSHDLPQVIISFEKQTLSHVVFNVVIVYVTKDQAKTIDKLIQNRDSDKYFHVERKMVIGYVNQLPKEAYVIRTDIPLDRSILKENNYYNYYRARQQVTVALEKILGKFRDYTGGMILKQEELFSEFKKLFFEAYEETPNLLENFFYSISPIEKQATLPLSQLECLFELVLEATQNYASTKPLYFEKVSIEEDKIYLVICSKENSLELLLKNTITELGNEKDILFSTWIFQEVHFFAFLYEEKNERFIHHFYSFIKEGLREWSKQIQEAQVLNLCCTLPPLTLDPRHASDTLSDAFARMLFEGLMSEGEDNRLNFALATSVDISEDLREYTFHLRDSFWSNGSKITAQDFEYSWKKMLSPNFFTPYAFLFYVIKNAKLAKENLIPLDAVGIKVIDELTLKIELEAPISYFLELTSISFFYPVHRITDQMHPNWVFRDGEDYVCNGPFQLKSVKKWEGYELIKNTYYWDLGKVKLDKILIHQTNSDCAQEMFKNNQVDWLGKPFISPWEPYFSAIGDDEEVQVISNANIYWGLFNVKVFPFHHPKVRRALALAIHRKEIIDLLSHQASPASTPLPLFNTQIAGEGMEDGNDLKARLLLNEALQELGICQEDFPIIIFSHVNLPLRQKIAKLIALQWKKVLNLNVQLESCEWNELYHRLIKGEYQVSTIAWNSKISDPIYTLDTLESSTNTLNFTKWENQDYKKTLHLANQEANQTKRAEYLKQAEKILLAEMPIVPLFYENDISIRKKHLKNIEQSLQGYIDFKFSHLQKEIL